MKPLSLEKYVKRKKRKRENYILKFLFLQDEYFLFVAIKARSKSAEKN